MEGAPQKRTTEIAPGVEFPTGMLTLAISPLGDVITGNIRRHDFVKSFRERASGITDMVTDDYVDSDEPHIAKIEEDKWLLTTDGYQWFVDSETLRRLVAGEAMLELPEA